MKAKGCSQQVVQVIEHSLKPRRSCSHEFPGIRLRERC